MSVLLVGGGIGGAAGARAAAAGDVPELSLTWHAPPDCPSPAEVEKQFVRLLGGPGRTPSAKRLEAVATVRHTARDFWSLRLETVVEGASGQRTLEGDSCWAVASAAALILALAIDPAAAERAMLVPEAPPAPAPPPPSAIPRQAPPVTAPAPAPEPRPSTAVRPYVRLVGGGVVALLPRAALAAGLAVGLRGRLGGRLGGQRWAAEVSGTVTQQRRGFAADGPGTGGDFRLMAAAARGCALFGEGRLGARVCAAGVLERISARGFGVDAPGSGSALLVAGELGAALTLAMGRRFELSLGVSGAGRPYRPVFILDGVGRVFSVPAVSGAAELGLAAYF